MTAVRVYRQKSATPKCFRLTELVTEQDIVALRALERGEATPYQQQLALYAITVKIAGVYDQPFVPGHDDQTHFRSGRTFVGQKIQSFLKVDIDILLGGEHEEAK